MCCAQHEDGVVSGQTLCSNPLTSYISHMGFFTISAAQLITILFGFITLALAAYNQMSPKALSDKLKALEDLGERLPERDRSWDPSKNEPQLIDRYVERYTDIALHGYKVPRGLGGCCRLDKTCSTCRPCGHSSNFRKPSCCSLARPPSWMVCKSSLSRNTDHRRSSVFRFNTCSGQPNYAKERASVSG